MIRLILVKFFTKESENFSRLMEEKYSEYKAHRESIDIKAVKALLIAEDHRFFKHGGIDLIALPRAFFKVVFMGKLEGGSTIEQQLSRTVTGLYKKCISRKLIELGHASLLSSIVPKNEIPGMYLYYAYFGTNMNGYHQALKRLGFDNCLTTKQACGLIARLKYPEPEKFNIALNRKIENRVSHILHLYNSKNRRLNEE